MGEQTAQTSLAVDFLIIGGGIGGLSCAIALRRVGHRVTLLEQSPTILQGARSGGIRLPPNASKIFFHWGLEKKLRRIALKSEAVILAIRGTAECLGIHVWDEEVLKETRGEFLFCLFDDLQQILYDTAVELGADIRMNTPVESIDPDNQTVTLASGNVLRADVIVGADGPLGVTRRILLEMDNMEVQEDPPFLNFYSTTIPKELMMKDPDLKVHYHPKHPSQSVFMGDGCFIQGFPYGHSQDYALYVHYPPSDGIETWWDREVPLDRLEAALATAHPKLRKFAKVAHPPKCMPVRQFHELEDWVHDSGRMVAIGQAAHPMPPGAVQVCAMTVEDGAVLAKLFSHLRTEDQIGSFLWAFQDLRQPRCNFVIAGELGQIHFMMMPPSEMAQARDDSMRMRRDAGVNVLSQEGDAEETPEWTEIKEVFGYDAEDEADNWWVQWGLLRERARGVETAAVNIQLDVHLNANGDYKSYSQDYTDTSGTDFKLTGGKN